jgi:hypothetical protein
MYSLQSTMVVVEVEVQHARATTRKLAGGQEQHASVVPVHLHSVVEVVGQL